jgi:hypothetical protein
MSINKLISIKNPIIDAMDMMAVDHNAHLPMVTQWAYLAEKEIGSYYQYERKWKVLDICGCVAHLPDDAVKVEYAILGDQGCECGDFFYKVFSNPIVGAANMPDNTFLVVDANGGYDSNASCGIIPYGYQNNKLIFDAQVKQSHVTIQYLGYKTDCEGFMEISENHVEAITHYILYKWLLRKRKKTSAEFQEMQWNYKEWDRLCAHSRSLDSQLTQTEREQIAQLYHNPYSGRGLWVGMNTTFSYGRFNY